MGCQEKNIEPILERKADFESFKNGAQVIERTCNTIQSSISLWKDYLEDILKIINGQMKFNHTRIIG